VLKRIGLVLVLLVGVLVGIVAVQPSTYTVKRSIEIFATPCEVIAHINSTRACYSLSPWHRIDPEMQIR